MKRIKTQVNNGDETQVTQFNPVACVGTWPWLLRHTYKNCSFM